MKNYFVHQNFYPKYKELRNQFENNFKNTKSTDVKRFVWDFWYDQDLYHLIRTPAYNYFEYDSYVNFHSALVQWGRENLGCHDISPPWLSYYVDGCYQKLHSDVPHGPWAFVYSLTPNKKKFIGGETLILKQDTLNYWNTFDQNDGREFPNYFDVIESKMNQLVIFDPRFPHGVSELKGTRDPIESRLVMHGWFVNPRPYVVGGLNTKQVQKGLNHSLNLLNQILEQISLLHGVVSIRLDVNKAGVVTNYKILTNTLLSINQRPEDVAYLNKQLKQIFKYAGFVATKKESKITLPLIFK